MEFGVEVSLEDVLVEGIRRLQDKGTWKVWQFGGAEFYDQDSFRSFLHASHLPQELLHLLPKDDPKGAERPAEAALRQRMTDLLQQVCCQGAAGKRGWRVMHAALGEAAAVLSVCTGSGSMTVLVDWSAVQKQYWVMQATVSSAAGAAFCTVQMHAAIRQLSSTSFHAMKREFCCELPCCDESLGNLQSVSSLWCSPEVCALLSRCR